MIEHRDNIFIVGDESINHWVRHARLVIHNGCTTGFEAAISETPVIAYKPIISPSQDRPVPDSVSHQVYDESELSVVVRRVLEDKSLAQSRLVGDIAVLQERFANVSSRLAAECIVDEWEKLENQSLFEKNPALTLQKYALLYQAKQHLIAMRSRLMQTRNSTMRVRGYKFTPLCLSEIAGLHQGFIDALNRFKNIRVRLYGKHLIGLTLDKS